MISFDNPHGTWAVVCNDYNETKKVAEVFAENGIELDEYGNLLIKGDHDAIREMYGGYYLCPVFRQGDVTTFSKNMETALRNYDEVISYDEFIEMFCNDSADADVNWAQELESFLSGV